MKKHLRTLPFGIVLAVALAAWRCGSSAVTSVTGPTATRCQASVTNSSSTFGPSGGTGTLSISIDRECSWSASTPVSWIQLTSAATSGQGPGSVSYRVAANPDPVVRRSAIAAAETQANIAQDAAPCEYSLSGPTNALPAPGGSTTIDIRTNAACSWSAKPSGTWVVVQPASGNGTATITITAGANTGAARTLTITVGSASVDVQQQAAAPGTPVPAPAPAPAPSPSPGPGPAPTPTPDPTPTPAPPPPPPPSTTVDLTGKVSELSGKCPTLTFALDVFTIEATKTTTYSGGGCKDIKDGTDVEVRGTQTGTTVTASSIAIKKGHH